MQNTITSADTLFKYFVYISLCVTPFINSFNARSYFLSTCLSCLIMLVAFVVFTFTVQINLGVNKFIKRYSEPYDLKFLNSTLI